jgi:hypothetical protein
MAGVKENGGGGGFQRARDIEVRGDGDAGEALINELLDEIAVVLDNASDTKLRVRSGEAAEAEGLLQLSLEERTRAIGLSWGAGVGDGVKSQLGAALNVVEERLFARGHRGRAERADLAFPILGENAGGAKRDDKGESSYDVHVCS